MAHAPAGVRSYAPRLERRVKRLTRTRQLAMLTGETTLPRALGDLRVEEVSNPPTGSMRCDGMIAKRNSMRSWTCSKRNSKRTRRRLHGLSTM